MVDATTAADDVSTLADDVKDLPKLYFNNTFMEHGVVSLPYDIKNTRQIELRNIIGDQLTSADLTVTYTLNAKTTTYLTGVYSDNKLIVTVAAGTPVNATYYYMINISIKDASKTAGKTWADSTQETKTFSIQIIKRSIKVPTYYFVDVQQTESDPTATETEIACPSNTYTVEYDYYNTRAVRLRNFDTDYYDITFGLSSTAGGLVTPDSGEQYYQATYPAQAAVGNQYVRVTLKNDANMQWEDSYAGKYKDYFLNIVPKKLEVPHIIDADEGSEGRIKTVTYNGSVQTVLFTPIRENEIAINASTSGSTKVGFDNANLTYTVTAINVKTYEISFKLASTTNYEWKNGEGTVNQSYTFNIIKKAIQTPQMRLYDNDSTYSSPTYEVLEANETKQIPFRMADFYWALYSTDINNVTVSNETNTKVGVNYNKNFVLINSDIANNQKTGYLKYYSNNTSYKTSPVNIWTITITPSSNCTWEDGTTGAKTYYLQIVKAKIGAPAINEADDPTLPTKKTLNYTGSLQSIIINNTQYNAVYRTNNTSGSSYTDPTEASNTMTFSATNVGTYTLTVGLKQAELLSEKYDVYEWADLGTNGTRQLTLVITKKAIARPILYNHDTDTSYGKDAETAVNKPITNGSNTVEVEYRPSGNYYFSLHNYYSAQMSYSWAASVHSSYYSASNNSTYSELRFSITSNSSYNIGTWAISVTPGSNYMWDDESTDAVTYTVIITKAKVAVPQIVTEGNVGGKSITLPYTGVTQNVVLANAATARISTSVTTKPDGADSAASKNADASQITWTANNAGDYTLRLAVSNASLYQWADDDEATYRYYYLTINRKNVDAVPEMTFYDTDSTFTKDGVKASGLTYITEYKASNRYFIISPYDSKTMSYTVSDSNYLTVTVNENVLRVTLKNYSNKGIIADHTVTITPNSNYIWNEPTPNFDAKVYTMRVNKFTVDVPKLVVSEDEKDTVVGNTRTVLYDGTSKSLTFAPATNTYVKTNAGDLGMTEDWTSTADTLILWAVNANTYEVTISVSNSNFYQWKGGIANPTYFLKIERKQIASPVFTQVVSTEEGNTEVVVNNRLAEVQYSTVSEYKFKITNVDTTNYVTYTSTSATGYKVTLEGTTLTLILNAGVSVKSYTVTITPKDSYSWDDGSGSEAKVFTVSVTAKSVAMISIHDNNDGGTIEGFTKTIAFNDTYRQIHFTPVISGEVKITFSSLNTTTYPVTSVQYDTENSLAYVSALYVNTYTISVALANTTNFIWYDGTTDAKTFQLQITQKHHDFPQVMFNGEVIDGNTAVSEYDANNAQQFMLFYPADSTQTFDLADFTMGKGTSCEYKLSDDHKTLTVTVAKGVTPHATNYNVKLTPKSITSNSTTIYNHCWEDGSTVQHTYTLNIMKKRLVAPKYFYTESKLVDDETTVVDTEVEGGSYSVVYNGQPYQIKFTGAISGQISLSTTNSPTRKSWTGDTMIYAMTNANTYKFTFTVNNTSYYEWETGVTSFEFEFIINRKETTNPEYSFRLTSGGTTDYVTIDSNRYETEYNATSQYVRIIAEYAAIESMSPSSSNLKTNTASWNATDHFMLFYASVVEDYTITVKLNSNYCWPGGNTSAMTFMFILGKKHVIIPQFVDLADTGIIDNDARTKTNIYTGSTIYATLDNCFTSEIVVDGSYNGYDHNATTNEISFTGNAVRSNYYVTLRLKNTTSYIWEDNTSGTRKYTLIITKQSVTVPSLFYVNTVNIEGGGTAESLEEIFTAATYTYSSTGHKMHINSIDNDKVSINAVVGTTSTKATITSLTGGGYDLLFTKSGTYTVTIGVKNTTNFKWEGTEDDSVAKTYTVTIGPQHIAIPTIEGITDGYVKTVTYDGTSQSIHLITTDGFLNSGIFNSTNTGFSINWNDDGTVTYTGPINASSYDITLTLKDTSNYVFSNNKTSHTYTLKIDKQEVIVPTLVKDAEGCTDEQKTVVYTGEAHYISFMGYDSTKMTLGAGGLSIYNPAEDEDFTVSLMLYGSTVNTYTISFSLTSNYIWSTGESGSKNFKLVIQKRGVQNPSVSKSNVTSDGEVLGYLDSTRFVTENYSYGVGNVLKVYVTYTGHPISIVINPCVIGSEVKVVSNAGSYQVQNDGTAILTMTNVGTYSLRLRIQQTGYFNWANGDDGTDSRYDRWVYLIIEKQTVIAPTLVTNDGFDTSATASWLDNVKTVTFNGSQQYISITGYNPTFMSMTNTGLTKYIVAAPEIEGDEGDEGEGGESSATAPLDSVISFYAINQNTYNVVFSLINSNYIWNTGSTGTVTIKLVINPKSVEVPHIEESSTQFNISYEYNGLAQYMTITPWVDTEISIISKPNTLSVDADNSNKFYAVNFGDYVVELGLKNSNYIWADTGSSSSTRKYTLKITAKPIAIPTIIPNDKETGATINGLYKYVTFNGEKQTIDMSVVYDVTKVSLSSNFFADETTWNAANNTYTANATNVATYTATFTLKNNNYKWEDGADYNVKKYLYLVIEQQVVEVPSIIVNEENSDGGTVEGRKKTIQYSGSALSIYIAAQAGKMTASYSSNLSHEDGWTSDTNTLHCYATDVADYTVTFTLINTTNYKWADNVSGKKTITFSITKKALTVPTIVGNDANNTKTVMFEENNFNAVTQFMYISPIPSKELVGVVSRTTGFGYSYNELTHQYECYASNVLLSGNTVSSYSITIQIENTTNYEWEDHGANQRTFYFRIEPRAVAVPVLFEVVSSEKDGKTVTEDKAVDGNTVTFEYDGKQHYVRLNNMTNGIINYSNNSVGTSTGTYSNYNGNMESSADVENGIVTFQASHVYLNYQASTIDYTITVSLANTTNYCWNDGNRQTKPKYFYVRINRKKLVLPTIENNEASSNMYYKYFPYDNQNHEYVLQNVDLAWMTYASYNATKLEVTELEGNKLKGQTLFSDVANYYTTLTLSDTKNTCWSDNKTDTRNYYIAIQTAKIPAPSVVGNNTQKYTGDDYVFQYQNVRDDGWMTYTLSNMAQMKAVLEDGILTVTINSDAPIGTYYVQFALKNSDNVRWANYNTSYNYQAQTRYVYTQKAQLTIPSIEGNGTSYKKTTVYNYKAQELNIVNYLNELTATGSPKWMSHKVTSTAKFNGSTGLGTWDAENSLLKFNATNVGTYTVRISTNSFCTFTDNSTYKDYTLQIDKVTYTSPFFTNDGVGTTTATVKTFTYNFAMQYAMLNNVVDAMNITTGIMQWWDSTGYASGTADDHKLQLTWDKDNETLKIGAQYVGTYYLTFKIPDALYSNARWSTTTSQSIQYKITVNKASLTIPTVLRTNLGVGESISGNYKYATYSGNNVVAEIKDVDSTYMTWTDTTTYANKADDHKAVLEYNATTKVLTIKAKYVATYSIQIKLKDTSNSIWVTSSSNKTQTYTYGIVINKLNHAYPTVVSGVSTSVTYTGEDVLFKIQNVVYGSDKYEVTFGNLKQVSWVDGVLTLSAKEVGTYTVKVSIIDTNNTSWSSYTSRTFNFYINRKPLSAAVSFSSTNATLNAEIKNGKTSWASGMPVFFNVDITGLNQVEGETVGLNVYMYNANNTSVTTALVESGTRRYIIPTSLGKGTYYVVAQHAAATDNYTLGTYKTKFVIDSDPAGFTERDLVWQYAIGNGSKLTISGSHSTLATALELEYKALAYNFSITLTEEQLANLNVRIVSYSGNTSATDSSDDIYSVTVNIAAINSNYYFPETAYTLYYKINKAKIDVSSIVWDYSKPFVYDGSSKSVGILGSSLPAGLTVSRYTGDISATDASEGTGKKYTTSVLFNVANDNYKLPVQGDITTYTGSFAWSCSWEINKAEIEVEWKSVMKVDENSEIFYVPVLVTGDEKVNYSYEKMDEDGAWEPVAVLKKTLGKAETYRVTPTLKAGENGTPNYAKNFKLVVTDEENNPLTHEFTVGENQYLLVMHLEVNGMTGESFPYTGNPYVATAVIDQDDSNQIEIRNSVVKYYLYDSVANDYNAEVANATNVGKYKVAITITYGIVGREGDGTGTGEYYFEVVKGTLDTSKLKWVYLHDGTVYNYDAAQGKWINANNNNAEISGFEYDGKEHKLYLQCGNSNNSTGADLAVNGFLTVKNLKGNVGTLANDYNTSFDFVYDSDNWNDPTISFPSSLKWKVDKAKINLSGVAWNYSNPFTFELDENGQPVEHSVALVYPSADAYADFATYFATTWADIATLTITGNTAKYAGTYTATFAIKILNNNYQVVQPDILESSISWDISSKKLVTPDNNGDWAQFDNAEHDLLNSCGVENGWNKYYDITVEYAKDGSAFAAYSGYNGSTFGGYHAGTYKLTFALKSGLNIDGNINVMWDSSTTNNKVVTVTVDKLVITVTGWNASMANSTAITDNESIAPTMIGYTIKDGDDNTYTKAEAEALGGGIVLSVSPYILDAYKDNATLTFVDEDYRSYSYKTVYNNIKWLDNPALVTDTFVYDRQSHTFALTDGDLWTYLETVDGSSELTQTEAGDYSITLRIKAGSNASWRTADGEIDDKTTVTLYFSISIKTIELPVVSNYEFNNTEHNVLANLDDEFLTYVKVKDSFSATDAGEYTFSIELKNTTSCMWSDGTAEKKTFTWNIEQKTLATPDGGGWSLFDGEVHDLVADCGMASDWSNYLDVTVEYAADGITFESYNGYSQASGDEDNGAYDAYSAYKTGVYRLTFSIKSELNSSADNIIWASGNTEDQIVTVAVSKVSVSVVGWNDNRENSTVKLAGGATLPTRFFEYRIYNEGGAVVTVDDVLTSGAGVLFKIKLAVKAAYTDYAEINYADSSYEEHAFVTEKLKIAQPELRFNSVEFDGNAHTFEIVNWDNYSKYLEIRQGEEYLTQTAANEYSIVLAFKPNSVAMWNNGKSDDLTLTFNITTKSIVKPTLASTPYTGSEIDILAAYKEQYGSDYIQVVSGEGIDSVDKATNAGTYKVVIALKYPESTTWQGGNNANLTLNWTIEQNKLTKPAFDNSWKVFDAQAHDLLALCKVPENWATYYTVSIEYAADGTSFSAYSGYNGSAYSAYNCGSYSLTFEIKAEHNPDGAQNIVWSNGSLDDVTVVINVAKLELEVVGWNENKAASTVKLKAGTLPAGVAEYVVKNSTGIAVSEATVNAAGYGEKFTIELNVIDTANVKVTYAKDGLNRLAFANKVMVIDTPTFEVETREYDGTNFTFIIDGWDLLSPYIELTSASDKLTQLDAGDYSVTLHIIDTVLATWAEGKTDDITLNFSITKVVVNGSWNEETEDYIPQFELASTSYPSGLLNVTYTDVDGNVVAANSFKPGVTYKASIAFAGQYGVNYVFADGIEKEVEFIIPIVYTILDKPTLVSNTAVYTGVAQTFKIADWATLKAYLEIKSGSLTVTAPGDYSITVGVKSDVYVQWKDDGLSGDVTLKFKVNPATVTGSWTIEGDRLVPEFIASVAGFAGELPSDLLRYEITNSDGEIVSAENAKEDGAYYVTVAIKYVHNKNFTLDSGVQAVYAYMIVKGVLQEKTLEKFEKPVFDESSVIYDGNEHTFTIMNWDSVYDGYLEIVEGGDDLNQTAAGKYTLTLRFKSNMPAQWTTGGREDVVLTFEILKATVKGEWKTEGSAPVLEISADGFDELDEGLISYVIKNAAGEIVEAPVANVTYYITAELTGEGASNFKFDESLKQTFAYRIVNGKIVEVIVKKLPYPQLTVASLEYNGEDQTFEIANWADYKDYLVIKSGSLTQKQEGTYKVIFAIADTTLATWENGKTGDYTVSFVITERVIPPTTHEFPAFDSATLEYSGSAQQFTISGILDYLNFVEITGDSLIQTDVGTYTITVHITDNKLFTWADGSTDDKELTFEITRAIVYIRWNMSGNVPVLEQWASTIENLPADLVNYVIKDAAGNVVAPENTQHEVTYYITASINEEYLDKFAFATGTRDDKVFDTTTLAFRIDNEDNIYEVIVKRLLKPMFDIDSVEYDGEEHTFVISNIDELKDYLRVVQGDSFLTQIKANTYTAVFRIIDPTIATWEDGTSDDYSISFTIRERKAPMLKLAKPQFAVSQYEYTGAAQKFEILNWLAYQGYVEVTGSELTQQYKGNYKVTVHIIDPALFTWSDGTYDDVPLSFAIVERTAPLLTLDTPRFMVDSVEYDGNAHTFDIHNWDIYKNYVDVSGSLTQTEVGSYSVTLYITDKSLFTWSDGTTDNVTLFFEVTKPQDVFEGTVTLEVPSMVDAHVTYDGLAHTFRIENWADYTRYVEVVEGATMLTQTKAGVYTVTLRLKDKEHLVWSNGSTDDLVLTFKINRLELGGSWYTGASVPTPGVSTSSPAVEIPDDLLVKVIKDKNGNLVDESMLVAGETYFVTYSIDSKYADTYTLPLNLTSARFCVNADGTCEIVQVEEEEKDFLASYGWMLILMGVILVLFLAGLITFLVIMVVSRYKAENGNKDELQEQQVEAQ